MDSPGGQRLEPLVTAGPLGDNSDFPLSWLSAILCSIVGNIMWGDWRDWRKGKFPPGAPGPPKRLWRWLVKGGWRKGEELNLLLKGEK